MKLICFVHLVTVEHWWEYGAQDRNIISPRIRSIGRTRNASESARLSQGEVKLLLHGGREEQLVGQGPFHHAILGDNQGEEWTAYPYDMGFGFS